MKRNTISKAFFVAPLALIALAAMPEQAQAGRYISSRTYVTTTPTYTYVPTSTVYYYSNPTPCQSTVIYNTYPTSTYRVYGTSVNTISRPVLTPRVRTFRRTTFRRSTRILY